MAAPPRPRGNPVLGSALDLRSSQIRTYERVMREHGDVVRLAVGPPGARFDLYCVFHPDGVKAVLAGSREGYSKGNRFYQQIAQAFGRGLLTSEGEHWQRQRRIIQPLFTRKQVAAYAELMSEEAAAVAVRWDRAPRDGGDVDANAEMVRLGATRGRTRDLRRRRRQGRRRARLGLPRAQPPHVPARDVAAGAAGVLADPGQPQGGARPASALRGGRRADRESAARPEPKATTSSRGWCTPATRRPTRRWTSSRCVTRR